MTRHWVDTAAMRQLARDRAKTAEALAFANGPDKCDLSNKLIMIDRMIEAVEAMPND